MERTKINDPVDRLKNYCKGKNPFEQYGEDNREWRNKAISIMQIPYSFGIDDYLPFVNSIYSFVSKNGCPCSIDQPVSVRQRHVINWLNK